MPASRYVVGWLCLAGCGRAVTGVAGRGEALTGVPAVAGVLAAARL